MSRIALYSRTSLFIVALLVSCAGRTPSSAVTSFYRAVEKGDTETAIGLIVPETVNLIGEEKIKAGLQDQALKIKAKGGISSIELTDEQVVGEVATIVATLKFGDGGEEREDLKLRKQNGKWRIEPTK